MSEWLDDRTPDDRDELDTELSSGRLPRWKQDQADIDRERDDQLYESWGGSKFDCLANQRRTR